MKRTTLMAMFLMCILPAAAMAVQPFMGEDFGRWSAVNLKIDGSFEANGWRFFSTGGAQGQLERITDDGNGLRLRLTRGTANGDTGFDRGGVEQAVFIPGSSPVVMRVWARTVSGGANLDLRLAEYQGANWLSIDNPHTYTLTDDFAPYSFNVTLNASTDRVNPSVRTSGVGTIEIQRIEVFQADSADGHRPRIQLPQGWVPQAAPVLWWGGIGHAAQQVQISPGMDFASIYWDSGIVISGADHQQLGELTAGVPFFARVRLQDVTGAWSEWSDPTLVVYKPLAQLPPSDLYVYDVSSAYGKTPAEAYEQSQLATALQGLVNRKGPRMFMHRDGTEITWLNKLRQPGRWMENVSLEAQGTVGEYRVVDTPEGTAIRITKSTTQGADFGIDRISENWLEPPASSSVTFRFRARSLQPGTQLVVTLAEHDADKNWLMLNNTHAYTPGVDFTDYSFTITTNSRMKYINPAFRIGSTGVVEVTGIHIGTSADPTAYMTESFATMPRDVWVTPGFYYESGWRMFGLYASNIVDTVNHFAGDFDGVVLWDPAVPATSNVAMTIAGVENLLPIPKRNVAGSLYQMLVTGGPHLTVKRDLAGMFTGTGTIPETNLPSSGSAKNDAYRWAIEKYVKTGKTDPAKICYYVDAYGGNDNNNTAEDYFVMQKGFVWDLDVWGDEIPVDDPGQAMGTDLTTLKSLLLACAERITPEQMIQCGGFPPFSIKYSTYGSAGGKHDPVPTEWECMDLLTAYNAYCEADGVISNCSIYHQMPRPTRINQSPPPLYDECVDAGWITATGQVAKRMFVLHYVGDYDAPAWLNSLLPPKWDHFYRGQVPIPWGWDPNTSDRGHAMWDEYIHTRTPRDFIQASDSGAGYINPNQLFPPRNPSGLPSGVSNWIAFNKPWYRMFDIRHTGFIIEGNSEPSSSAAQDIFESFSGDGIVDGWTTAEKMVGSMPVIKMKNIGISVPNAGVPTQAAANIANLAANNQKAFIPIRSILQDPGFYYKTNYYLRNTYAAKHPAFLLPSEFFYLLRYDLGGQNIHRASFIYDTMPDEVTHGQTVTGKLWLRNIGWDTWAANGDQAVKVAVELNATDTRGNPVLIALPGDVAPGQMIEVPFSLMAPATDGQYLWRIDLVQGDSTWFSEHGNLNDARGVSVVPNAQVSAWELWSGSLSLGGKNAPDA